MPLHRLLMCRQSSATRPRPERLALLLRSSIPASFICPCAWETNPLLSAGLDRSCVAHPFWTPYLPPQRCAARACGTGPWLVTLSVTARRVLPRTPSPVYPRGAVLMLPAGDDHQPRLRGVQPALCILTRTFRPQGTCLEQYAMTLDCDALFLCQAGRAC